MYIYLCMFFSLCRFTLTLFPLCFCVHVFHQVVLAIEENYKTIKSIQATFIGVHRSWVSAFVFFSSAPNLVPQYRASVLLQRNNEKCIDDDDKNQDISEKSKAK